LPFYTDSKLAQIVATMRSASPTDNPFQGPRSAPLPEEFTPDAVEKMGAASVQILHGLADLTELSLGALADNRTTADDLAGLLTGLGQAIREAAHDDARGLDL